MPEIPEAVQRLAIYARVSTEEQREGQTIDSQVAELSRFASKKGWPVIGIYKDAGWSGAVMERPELDRLRDDAQKGLFDTALINDVDRLARDVAHLGVIKRDLERKGIKVVFRKLPSDSSPTSNLMVNILGSFAEFERELIADRTRRGRRHKVEVRKQYLGSNTAYGYRYIPMDRITGRDGILEIQSSEAQVVRQMFEWVDSEGLSARRVQTRLNQLGITPRKRASRWAKSSVLRILHCETYAGVWHYNKHQGCEPKNPTTSPRYRRHTKGSVRCRPRSEWIPLQLPKDLHIVARERWERVQRQLKMNIAFSPRNDKHSYLLKSLLRCGACSGPYVGDPCHGRFFYRCGKRCRKLPSINETAVNGAVKDAIRDLLTNPEVLLKPLQALDLADAHDVNQREQATPAIEREAAQLNLEERRILDAYREGVLSPVQLGQQLQGLKTRRESLDQRRIELERIESINPAQAQRAVSDYCAEAANNLDGLSDEKWRELLRTVISTIIFHGDHIVIRGRIPLPSLGSVGNFQVSGDVTRLAPHSSAQAELPPPTSLPSLDRPAL